MLSFKSSSAADGRTEPAGVLGFVARGRTEGGEERLRCRQYLKHPH